MPHNQFPLYAPVGGHDGNKRRSGSLHARIARWLLLAWVVSGLVAFLSGMMCFGKSGRPVDHVTGLLLAIFYGPMYWVFYLTNTKYCK